jgi:hypothetical protein
METIEATRVGATAVVTMNQAFESERSEVCAKEALAHAGCKECSLHAEAVDRFVTKQPPTFQWPD